MTIRPMNPGSETDRDQIRRTWVECGWAEAGTYELVDHCIEFCDVEVGLLDDEIECVVTTLPGDMRYLVSRCRSRSWQA